MIAIRENIKIASAVEDVFDFITDISRRKEFIPELEDVIFPEGPQMSVGMKYIEVASIAGRRIETEYQVIDLRENKYIAVNTIKAIFPIQVILLLTPDGEEVLLTIDLKAELNGIYKVASPLIKIIIADRTRNILKNIKRVLQRQY